MLNHLAPQPDLAVTLPIHETFQQTLQGEGYWAGTPVDFIRLAGCPVGCPWCDTGYADGGQGLPRQGRPLVDLLAELRSPRVVVSGGEPMIQTQLPALIEAILATGRAVNLETSGSHWQPIPAQTWVTLSPKHHVSPRYPVLPKLWERANEIKLVISTAADLDFYQSHLATVSVPVFLQPEWHGLKQSLPGVLDLLRQHPHYRLSVQLHKYLQIP